MFEKPSLMLRIGIGKFIGLAFGLVAFFMLPLFGESDVLFRLGLLCWLVIMGAFIGLFGVVTHYPIINMPIKWWLRGMMIGAMMMFTFWLIAYARLDAIAIQMFGAGSIFANGAWVIIDGIIMGLIIAFIATKFAGEGKETVER